MDTGYAHQYGDLEEKHWWFRARRNILQSTLARLAWPEHPRILEIGVGSGLNLYTLYPADAQLTGIEPEESNAVRARLRGPVPVFVSTAERLPDEIADASLDAITMFDVLEHTQDDLLVLRTIRKKLKPGGRLILTVPAFMFLWGQQDDINYHFRRYTRAKLRTKLHATGFYVARGTYFMTLLFPPVAAFRMLARCLRRRDKPPETDFKYSVGPVDTLLYCLFATEGFLLRFMNFPFGVSVLAIAEKNGTDQDSAMRLSVVIPVFNEEQTHPELHRRLACATTKD